MQIRLDTIVVFPDGSRGLVGDVVIDPDAATVSHLIVHPEHHPGQARLIPISVFQPAMDDRLSCSEPIGSHPFVEDSQFVRLDEPLEVTGDWDIGIERVLSMPYFTVDSYDPERPSMGDDSDEGLIAFHRIPKGEIEIRRASPVYDSAGSKVGHVDGFVTNNDHITHIVLEYGHLWGRLDIAIPMASVRRVGNDQIELDLTADEVGRLPRPKFHRSWRR